VAQVGQVLPNLLQLRVLRAEVRLDAWSAAWVLLTARIWQARQAAVPGPLLRYSRKRCCQARSRCGPTTAAASGFR